MRIFVGFVAFVCSACVFFNVSAQVDTAFVYNPASAIGPLDIRISKSATRYYYLQENQTFSFRETAPGVRTNTYLPATRWDTSPYKEGNLREKNGNADYFVMNYRLLFPDGYLESYENGYPLVVMLHGAGITGNCWETKCIWATKEWDPNHNDPPAPTTVDHGLLNNDRQLVFAGGEQLWSRNLAGTRLPDDPSLPGRAFPGFALAPQNLNGWDVNSVEDVIRIIRLLIKEYNIDPDRIYVYGSSNGGIGTYRIIQRAPWLFAAAVPMSSPTDAGITYNDVTSLVRQIPFWIFQGALDTSPRPSYTRSYIRAFKEAGANVRYTEYADLQHTTWPSALREPDFFSWMLSHNKSNIHLPGGIASLCGTTDAGVALSLSEGFWSYQWEYNGKIITSAKSSSLIARQAGVYRARFSRVINPSPSDWNQWSNPVTVTAPDQVPPRIEQLGTVLLPDLNNENKARLRAPADFAYYYWYKDGTLVDLPGSDDDTVRLPVFESGACVQSECTGTGTFTLVVAKSNNCPSPPSSPLKIIFDDAAPVAIFAPTKFGGEPLDHGGVRLTWNDASANETGFEIWRRKQLNATTYSRWEMAGLTSANATTFIESGLIPSATYQYKIRAVGNGIRSAYVPSATDQFLTIQLLSDLVRPDAPKGLSARATGLREITLNWGASIDNTGINQYMVEYNGKKVTTGTPSTELRLTQLPLNDVFVFTVVAEDLDGNLSVQSATASAHTYVRGLYYKHTVGVFNDIDTIDWSFGEFSGTIPNFDLSKRIEDDYFNFRFDGYIYIHTPGLYQFELTSDEGSRLSIDDHVVVDHDGIHEYTSKTGDPIYLVKGPHLINCKYFEVTGPEALTVSYKGPDTQNQMIPIPESAITSGHPVTISDIRKLLAEIPLSIKQREFENGTQFNNREIVTATIYPNPAYPTDDLSLTLQFLKPVKTKVNILDLMGKSYYEFWWEPGMPNNIRIAPNQYLDPGVYITVLQMGNTTIRKKVVIRN